MLHSEVFGKPTDRQQTGITFIIIIIGLPTKVDLGPIKSVLSVVTPDRQKNVQQNASACSCGPQTIQFSFFLLSIFLLFYCSMAHSQIPNRLRLFFGLPKEVLGPMFWSCLLVSLASCQTDRNVPRNCPERESRKRERQTERHRNFLRIFTQAVFKNIFSTLKIFQNNFVPLFYCSGQHVITK